MEVEFKVKKRVWGGIRARVFNWSVCILIGYFTGFWWILLLSLIWEPIYFVLDKRVIALADRNVNVPEAKAKLLEQIKEGKLTGSTRFSIEACEDWGLVTQIWSYNIRA